MPPAPPSDMASAAFSRAWSRLRLQTAAPALVVVASEAMAPLARAAMQSVPDITSVVCLGDASLLQSHGVDCRPRETISWPDCLLLTTGGAIPKAALFANTTIMLLQMDDDGRASLAQVRRRLNPPLPLPALAPVLALAGMLPFAGVLLRRYGPARIWKVVRIQTQGQWQDFTDAVHKRYTASRNALWFAATVLRLRLRRPQKKSFPYEDHSAYR